MATTLKLEIVTPEARVFSDDVDMVTLPGAEGEMGVFPNHVPMMVQVAAGEILVRKGAEEHALAVGDGFADIAPDHVSILADMAVREENIDETKAEEARRRAEARLAEALDMPEEEAARVHAALSHALAQIKVKQRKHR